MVTIPSGITVSANEGDMPLGSVAGGGFAQVSECSCLDLALEILLGALCDVLTPEPCLCFIPESVGGPRPVSSGRGSRPP